MLFLVESGVIFVDSGNAKYLVPITFPQFIIQCGYFDTVGIENADDVAITSFVFTLLVGLSV